MSDLLKRLGMGGAIGLAMALFIGWGTYEIPFLKSLLDGYEFLSYDGRMRARTAGVEQMSIDDVVVIDIDNTSVAPPEEGGLGHYFDWPQAYHGRLINTVTSGNPDALLFDIIFDKENTFNYDLVNALTDENAPQNEALSDVTGQFLVSNDPSLFFIAPSILISCSSSISPTISSIISFKEPIFLRMRMASSAAHPPPFILKVQIMSIPVWLCRRPSISLASKRMEDSTMTLKKIF